MIEKKNYKLEKRIFSLTFVLKKSCLFWYDSSMGYTELIIQTKKEALKNFFLRKRCFSKNIFEWHSYKWRLQKSDDRKQKLDFRKIFHRKSFHKKFLIGFGMNYQWGYTRMMMELKKKFENVIFQGSLFSKKMFCYCYQWEYRVTKLYEEKHSAEYIFFVIGK